ncbi:hypothetical protein ACFL96_08675 [Thermoproteota archaeon]
MKKTIIIIICLILGFLGSMYLYSSITGKSESPAELFTSVAEKIHEGELESSSVETETEVSTQAEGDEMPVQEEVTAGEVQDAVVESESESEPVLAQEETEKKPYSALPIIFLKGIFYDEEGESMAIISDMILKEGDVIQGAKVSRIDPIKVIMEFEGREFTLRVK